MTETLSDLLSKPPVHCTCNPPCPVRAEIQGRSGGLIRLTVQTTERFEPITAESLKPAVPSNRH